MKNNILKFLLIFLPIISFLSCKKDLDDIKNFQDNGIEIVDWEPTFVAPLLNSKTTLGEVYDNLDTLIDQLEEKNVKLIIRKDGVFVLNYLYDYETGSMNDFYKIPRESQSIEFIVPQSAKNTIIGLPVGAPLNGVWDTTITFDIDPDYGALLEKIELGGGSLQAIYTHDFNQNIGVEVTIRSITNRSNGDTLQFSLIGSSDSEDITLDNHNVNLDYIDENAVENYNRLEIYVKTIGTVTNPILTGNKFTIDLSIGDYFMNYVSGFLGEFEAPIPSISESFELFEDIDLEGVYFKEPKMVFNIESTVGMPMNMRVDTLEFEYPDVAPRTLGVDGRTTNIQGVSQRNQIPNSPAISKDSIDRTNSEIENLLTSEPNGVRYAATFTSTDLNGADRFEFFLDKDSKLKANIKAELPLIFSVFEYKFSDTIKIDSLVTAETQDTINKYVERAELKMIFGTQLPFDVDVQGYFLDSNNQVITTVFDNGPHRILANTDLDANGVVKSINQSVTYLDIDQDKFNKVVGARKIVYDVTGSTSGAINSTPPVYVQLKSDYVFEIKAGILAKFKYDIPTVKLK